MIHKILVLISLILILLIINFINSKSEHFSNNIPKKYHIFYINLKHRKDRKEKILKEIKKLNQVQNCSFHTTRIEAIKDTKGEIGCGKSHILALEKALHEKLPYVIIMEDDIQIKEKEIINSFKCLHKTDNWDVFILSGHGGSKKINEFYSKALDIQTTGMYIIKSKYYNTLINCFQESVNKMSELKNKNKDINRGKWAIDMNWKKLQKKDNWLILNNNLGIQREDYSDIEHTKIDYSNVLK